MYWLGKYTTGTRCPARWPDEGRGNRSQVEHSILPSRRHKQWRCVEKAAHGSSLHTAARRVLTGVRTDEVDIDSLEELASTNHLLMQLASCARAQVGRQSGDELVTLVVAVTRPNVPAEWGGVK